uniref:ATP synthase subunit a n=1 Tax=Idotea baltica TaxID=82763 RepID=Q19TW8_9CRUS|nr:ATP synthase F0 subunit 6 [Idotea baltica]
MTNLFSVFDPSSSLVPFSLNWAAATLGLIFLPYCFWTVPSRYTAVFKSVEKALSREMNLLLGESNQFLTLIFLSMFIFIFMNNSLGMLPYVFTASSQLVISLSLALPLWTGYFIYGWVKHTTHMLAHLVPQGTPGVLMPFMVLIESISGVIRPGTLAVRLAANMIAGHLLLTLLSGSISIFSPLSGLIFLVSQIALLVLETAVAVIQAYVFAVLSTLYASEV